MGVVVLIGILIAGLAGLATWMQRRRDYRRLAPAVVATAVGIGVATAVYLWVFEVGPTCSGRDDFNCQVNANQGLLTLLGLVLAGGAVWTSVLTRFFDHRAAASELQSRVETILEAALEEVRHNLIHVALCYNDDRELQGLPMVKFDHTSQLLQDPIRRELQSGLLHSAEQIQRLATALDLLAKGEADDEGAESGDEPFCLAALVKQSLGLLVWAGATSQVGHDFLHNPGLQDLHEAVVRESKPFFCFRTSESELLAEAATIRTEDSFVICWWDDAKPERMVVFEQGPRFRDLAEGHAHKP